MMTKQIDAIEASLRRAWRRFVREGRVSSFYENWEQKRRGHTRYLTVMMPVQDENVVTRVQALQQRLRAIPHLDLHPPASLHLTIRGLGFRVAKRSAPDELDDALLPQVLEGIAAVARATPPFEVRLRRVNSWDTAPFIEARSGGRITATRAALAERLPFLQDFSYEGGFLPHLTVGYYNANGSNEAAVAVLRPLRYRKFGRLISPCLCVIEGPADDLYAPYDVVAEFKLTGSPGD
ncbi:MAG: 2'-5' RNA ligase family protein [Anaerolineae bacterium]|nr:2'-5' RNA ligase family protein [Anaerolineae bacterium]